MKRPSGTASAVTTTQKTTICNQPAEFIGAASEALGAHERVAEIGEERDRDGSAEDQVEGHGVSLENVAGADEERAACEEDDHGGQGGDIEHVWSTRFGGPDARAAGRQDS